MTDKIYIARPNQTLQNHLVGVGTLARRFAEKIGLGDHGELIGLLHDLGKYSNEFQSYLLRVTGQVDPDADDYTPANMEKKVDHSTAGAQWIWNKFKNEGGAAKACAKLLGLCIASHHSGLIDCLKISGEDNFSRRITKDDQDTHYNECSENMDKFIHDRAEKLANNKLIEDLSKKILKIISDASSNNSGLIKSFYVGFLTRFLFSCLIDADRIDSAKVENPEIYSELDSRKYDWAIAIERFEQKNLEFKITHPIDKIRKEISDHCREKASDPQGIYTLTVPTGGGKTFSSLRYALHHAHLHKLDKIIYIIPYTSIIDQNANAIRSIIEAEGDKYPWVLEHHSNLEPEKQTWHSKITSDNWDSPIILTTMVQFLEVLFGGGTRGARRLHQLANSILIFDEIQTLPIKCIHIFCNVLNFLVKNTKTTAVLCTATQPVLNELRSPEKGQLYIPKENELAKDVGKLFTDLERVDVVYKSKLPGWKLDEVAELALEEFHQKGNCLVIVNTKKSAQDLYRKCKEKVDLESIFHLSTNQYPKHRKSILEKIKDKLNKKQPVLLISTQLIEAGVDISFACVIRFLAGIDSIAQAAGRCNRNGELLASDGNPIKGIVYVINPEFENLGGLKEIENAQDTALRVFRELKTDDNLLTPEKIERFFKYYFYDRATEMDYNLSTKDVGFDTTLLNLLADNEGNSGRNPSDIFLRQSFMEAGKKFKAIDAATEAVIIQHGKGKEIVTELCAITKQFNPKRYYELLRKAQQYSVNVFPSDWKKLHEAGALYETQKDEGIYFLDERHYSEEFGVSIEHVAQMDLCHC